MSGTSNQALYAWRHEMETLSVLLALYGGIQRSCDINVLGATVTDSFFSNQIFPRIDVQ